MPDYTTLDHLRRNHPAWRLLASDHAPMVLAFLHRTFIEPNRRDVPESEMTERLEDFLHHLREQEPEAFPRRPQDYLGDWAADERAWLRRYYPPNTDEAHYDLTPATEKALDWVAELVEQRSFVGAESRLMTVFELLRQMVHGAETDPEARLSELERRRAEIDAEMERIRAGEVELMDATGLRERYYQVEQTARALLSDFRQVEQNFRELDRQVRERITTWEGARGELLGEVFGERDAIADSDQGRTFRAFWDFLMSPARQEELTELLERALSLGAVSELGPDRRLERIHFDWLEAGEATQRTVARLSEQLRRFLDDQARLEHRRIMELIGGVEQKALAVRGESPTGTFMEMDAPAPEIRLDMDRPLFRPPVKPHITEQVLTEGEADFDADALFEQHFVDRAELAGRIRRSLQTRDQIALPELLAEHPLEHGLAELVAYLSLAADDDNALIDEDHTHTIAWTDAEGTERRARVPLVIFARSSAQGALAP